MVKKIIIAVGCLIIVAVLFFAGFRIGRNNSDDSEARERIAELEETLGSVRTELTAAREIVSQLNEELSKANGNVSNLEDGISRLEEELVLERAVVEELRRSDSDIRATNTELGRSIDRAITLTREVREKVEAGQDE